MRPMRWILTVPLLTGVAVIVTVGVCQLRPLPTVSPTDDSVPPIADTPAAVVNVPALPASFPLAPIPQPPALAEVIVTPGITRIDLVVSFDDLDPQDSQEVVVDWGDGSSSVIGPAASPIGLCHTYDVPGVYDLRVVVTDSFGLQDSRDLVAGVPGPYAGTEPC